MRTGLIEAWEYDRRIRNATSGRVRRKPRDEDEGT
jgi:hypothetical protein